MSPEIIDAPMDLSLIGAGAPRTGPGRYASVLLGLLGRVWGPVKANAIANDGINWAVYEEGSIFAGVRAAVSDPGAIGLERRDIRLSRYARWTHIGPYGRLGETYAAMSRAIKALGLSCTFPLVEMYGHWTEDESKLETTIFWSVR